MGLKIGSVEEKQEVEVGARKDAREISRLDERGLRGLRGRRDGMLGDESSEVGGIERGILRRGSSLSEMDRTRERRGAVGRGIGLRLERERDVIDLVVLLECVRCLRGR